MSLCPSLDVLCVRECVNSTLLVLPKPIHGVQAARALLPGLFEVKCDHAQSTPSIAPGTYQALGNQPSRGGVGLGKLQKSFIFYKNKNEQGGIRNFAGFPLTTSRFHQYFYFEVRSAVA